MEINPLVATRDDRLIALDAKINFDDNALFRHTELQGWVDPSEQDPLELEPANYNLNYIRLNGNIGVMVNGAGLAMATMDMIKLYGGNRPIFWTWAAAPMRKRLPRPSRSSFRDRKVRAVLVNIFGGIMRCDILAERHRRGGHGKSADQVPLMIRLEGTNVERGKNMLQQSGLNFTVAEAMRDAAQKVVAVDGKA